jgi:hypothetical protein
VSLLARSARALLIRVASRTVPTVIAALAVLFAITAFTALAALAALWCAHRFVPEVRALVLCNCDATGKGGS